MAPYQIRYKNICAGIHIDWILIIASRLIEGASVRGVFHTLLMPEGLMHFRVLYPDGPRRLQW